MTEREYEHFISYIRDYKERFETCPYSMGFMEGRWYEDVPLAVKSLIEKGLLAWRKDMPADENYNDNFNVQLTPKGVLYVDKIV